MERGRRADTSWMRKHVRRCAALAAIVTSAFAISTASTPAPAATGRDACGDLQRVVIAGVATCTHGGDEPVPDIVATGSRSLATRSATPPAPCPGNGHG